MPSGLTMNLVSKRTGLSPHVIRVWEKRYGAVRPARSQGKRRVYSDEDVHRLGLFRRLTQTGHAISTIAHLQNSELETMCRREANDFAEVSLESSDDALIKALLHAVSEMDRLGLEETLRKSAVTFGAHGLLERVIGPLTERIGELWRTGEFSAAHEHFASVVIREYLWTAVRPFAPTQNAPAIIVTTPNGQLHELGAVMVAAAASDVGWNTIYLGPSLPPGEIASAAVKNKARAVALSIVYPLDDPHLGKELQSLRKHLPAQTALIVGGRGAPAYAEVLEEIGALQPATLRELYDLLDQIRKTK